MSKPTPGLERTHEIYKLRSELLRGVARISLEDLRRLVAIFQGLTDADLRAVAAYASALAEWPDPGSSSIADG